MEAEKEEQMLARQVYLLKTNWGLGLYLVFRV
jgi:hypothetical protein